MPTKTTSMIKIIALAGLLAIQTFMFAGIHPIPASAASPAQRPDNPEVSVPVDPEYIEAI